MHIQSTPRKSFRPPQRGFVLLEALIALAIFAFGVLALVGLQAAMTKTQTASKFRADAGYLAQQLIGAMWTDVPNLTSYATGNCTSYARCADWAGKVSAALPSSNYAVTVNATTGEVTVRIVWQQPNEEQHNYTAQAQIKS